MLFYTDDTDDRIVIYGDLCLVVRVFFVDVCLACGIYCTARLNGKMHKMSCALTDLDMLGGAYLRRYLLTPVNGRILCGDNPICSLVRQHTRGWPLCTQGIIIPSEVEQVIVGHMRELLY